MNDVHTVALETELVSLRKRTKIIEDKLNEVEFGNFTQRDDGKLAVEIRPHNHVAVMALAASLVDTLGKATNYVAIHVDSSSGPLEAIVQRVGPGFVTPHEGRCRAEAEVKRLLSVCAANGIEELTTLFMCGAFVPILQEHVAPSQGNKVDLAPWCILDIEAEPNVLVCERCESRQTLPEWKTSVMIKAMIDAFAHEHMNCVDTTNVTQNTINDDDGAE